MRSSKYLLILLICSIGLSQKYDPKTGELIIQEKYDPVTGEPIKTTQYDPNTGEPDDTSKPDPMFNNVAPSTPLINLGDNVSSDPSYLSIIKAAKAQAKREDQKQGSVNVAIGGLGCAASIIGIPLASLYALADTSIEPNNNYYNNLSTVDKTIYKTSYKSEFNRFKRSKVFGTMGSILGMFLAVSIFSSGS